MLLCLWLGYVLYYVVLLAYFPVVILLFCCCGLFSCYWLFYDVGVGLLILFVCMFVLVCAVVVLCLFPC